VRWTFYALVAAEELGITQANVEEQAAAAGNNPEINRLLGTEDELGSMMGVDPQWAVNAIKAVGNYGEIFDRHLGPSTALAIERGLNAQWTQGGLMYAPPFR
jgi:general L-amino acid transport system substrate-binding protein